MKKKNVNTRIVPRKQNYCNMFETDIKSISFKRNTKQGLAVVVI